MTRPSEPDIHDSPDPIPSSVWRKIVAASSEYELSMEQGESIEPTEFALRYQDIPAALLLAELKKIHDDFASGANRSELLGDELPPSDRYIELELIGTGGMGEVYRGLDLECQRLVAIKRISKKHVDNREATERFHAEAEMTAGLEHPGIIPVYGKGGDTQGREFYVMRLIAGDGTGTLTESIRSFHLQGNVESKNTKDQSGNLTEQLRGLVRRIVDIADTVAYVHHRGIVHRDLKPSNVLIGPYGETLIADWGLGIGEKNRLSYSGGSRGCFFPCRRDGRAWYTRICSTGTGTRDAIASVVFGGYLLSGGYVALCFEGKESKQ